MPEVTIAQLIEASKKNGFPWSRAIDSGQCYWYKNGEQVFDAFHAVQSCVVGQGVINLNGHVFPEKYLGDDEDDDRHALNSMLDDIYYYNDFKAESYEDALQYMEEKLAPYLDEVVEI